MSAADRRPRASMSAFAVCLVSASFACCGLVLDGGRLLLRYSEAADVAQSAARAGAQSVTGIRDGRPRLDRSVAVERARHHLDLGGFSGSVEVADDILRVEVVSVVETPVLSLVGFRRAVVTVTRAARIVEG